MKRLLPLAPDALLLALGIAAGVHAGPAAPDAAARHFFAQSAPDLKGRAQGFAQWKGKLLVVNFWATWCGPCVKEMPQLSALQAELAAKNVQIIGVGIDSADNIAAFAGKHAIGYPLYVAGQNGPALLGELGNRAGSLPYTLLIGRNGAIKKTYVGRLDIGALRKDLAE